MSKSTHHNVYLATWRRLSKTLTLLHEMVIEEIPADGFAKDNANRRLLSIHAAIIYRSQIK
jgi:hypothetical protein